MVVRSNRFSHDWAMLHWSKAKHFAGSTETDPLESKTRHGPLIDVNIRMGLPGSDCELSRRKIKSIFHLRVTSFLHKSARAMCSKEMTAKEFSEDLWHT